MIHHVHDLPWWSVRCAPQIADTAAPSQKGTASPGARLPRSTYANYAACRSASPNNRTALFFRMPGATSGLKPAVSKSFSHLSGMINE